MNSGTHNPTTRTTRAGGTPRRGFTLVEMLVVIGIIALVVSLLVPSLLAAKKAAQLSQCANNLRQIGAAVQLYLNDNDQILPEASSTNSPDSPYSPAGRHGPDDLVTEYLPPVAQLLDPYLKFDLRLWKCPAQIRGVGVPTADRSAPELRTGRYVIMGRRDTDPKPGNTVDDVSLWSEKGEWRPGYMYLSTKEYLGFRDQDDVTADFWMKDWIVRNVGGLSLSELHPIGREGNTGIVLFMDYMASFHSRAPQDLYEMTQSHATQDGDDPEHQAKAGIQRDQYRSNFLYLDGHCAARTFSWQGGLLNLIHSPIKQKVGRADLPNEEGYARYYRRSFAD